MERYTLKTWREIRKMSQKDAANKIGVSVDTLSNYERGKSFPDVPVIKRIEAVYDVPYDRIIFLTQNYG